MTEATSAERTPTGSAAFARFLQLVDEREPSVDQLLRERNAWPELYEPLSVMLENNVRGLVGTWRSE